MRAINIRPAEFRRISTSLTVRSKCAAGSYAVFTVAAAAEIRRDPKADAPAAPIAVILRKCRRPRVWSFMPTSMLSDCEGLTSEWGPDKHRYTPDALLSELKTMARERM